MSDKTKFLRTSNLIGPHAVRLAYDILYLNGLDPRSKGGQAKAAKSKNLHEKIRAESQAMKLAGHTRYGLGKKLATKYDLKQSTINKILRSK